MMLFGGDAELSNLASIPGGDNKDQLSTRDSELDLDDADFVDQRRCDLPRQCCVRLRNSTRAALGVGILAADVSHLVVPIERRVHRPPVA